MAFFRPADLFMLRKYGLSFAFPSVEVLSLAAKLRVVHTVVPDLQILWEKLADDDFFVPPAFANEWNRSSFLRTLYQAVSDATQKFQIRLSDEIRVLRSSCPRTITGSL